MIVERAQDAREQDKAASMKRKQEEDEEQKMQLHKIFVEMDADQSGDVSYDELLNAYHEIKEFRDIITLLDIHEDELPHVFKLIDGLTLRSVCVALCARCCVFATLHRAAPRQSR